MITEMRSLDLAKDLERACEGLDIVPLEKTLPHEPRVTDIRRARRSVIDDSIGIMSLVNREETLYWEPDSGIIPRGTTGRRSLSQRGTVIQQLKFEHLGVSQVGESRLRRRRQTPGDNRVNVGCDSCRSDVELKRESFKPEYKGQMELYLRWLAKHETEPGEESPLGIILCAGKNTEQI
jgi:hypothetical protein